MCLLVFLPGTLLTVYIFAAVFVHELVRNPFFLKLSFSVPWKRRISGLPVGGRGVCLARAAPRAGGGWVPVKKD